MTGIVIIPTPEASVIISDGACTNTKGILLSYASKVVLLPECSCVIAQRGAACIAQAVNFKLGGMQSLDELLASIENAARITHAEYIEHYKHETPWSMWITGWSDKEQRIVIHCLRSRTREIQNLESGKPESFAPFTLTPMPHGIVMAPNPTEAAKREFGAELDKVKDAVELGVRLVCAARFSQPREDESSDGDGAGAIGCFIQSTIVGRGFVNSEIIHRWPDVIGERVDPSRGERIPPRFLHEGEK
jgi:hypothetical protein